jgi:transposase
MLMNWVSYDGTMAEADGVVGRTGEPRQTDSARSFNKKDLGFVRGEVADFYGSKLEEKGEEQDHRALDDKAGVVTAVKTTTEAMDEASELIALIERHERVTAAKTKVAVADSRYGNTANLIALAQREIRAHVADLRSKLHNARSQGIYPPERFVDQTETDDYRCPAGEILYRHHHFVARRGYYEYRPKRGTCAGCRRREFCTRDQNGRTLKRYAGQELLDKARQQSHSPQARSDRKRRQWS